ncbi:uncharacterized protein FTJAE_3265 [Fusarium tjaetaba]|uniref:DUF6594 domain-containing protein n=1 Tax=Fusarium tjaetaba TaxID=1567544 RepID=A0A8H5RY98_9HYPO|nr:uncharacterized protein FTJAE_3265 [Fusarium tjaetaba]KAF5643465.1 hypothetical protein FTJAE_3265 [Fusarium tjaetaba]
MQSLATFQPTERVKLSTKNNVFNYFRYRIGPVQHYAIIEDRHKRQKLEAQVAKSGMAIICLFLTSCVIVMGQECSGNAITAEDEDRPLFLGSCERDQNTDRAKVVAELDEALEDLDKFLLRSRQISELEQADPRAVTNLQNWLNGTGSIARAESRFLNYPLQELLSTSPRDESAMIGLENNVAENLLRVRDYLFPSYSPKVSRDTAHIYIPTRSTAALISRALMIPIVVIMLLAPVILCSYLSNTSSRLFAVGGATVFFVAMISSGTRMKSQELIIAGATYATVLTVFLSESSGLPSG